MTEHFASWSRGCLTMQGYGGLNDGERRSLWLGLRFAPALCFVGIALGTVLASPILLLAMAATALIGGFLTPKHVSPVSWRRRGSRRSPLPSWRMRP